MYSRLQHLRTMLCTTHPKEPKICAIGIHTVLYHNKQFFFGLKAAAGKFEETGRIRKEQEGICKSTTTTTAAFPSVS